MELDRKALAMLSVLNTNPQGFGINEWIREAGRFTGRKGNLPRGTFYKRLRELKQHNFVELSKVGKRGKQVHIITERGKEYIVGSSFADLLRDLPFVDSAERALKMIRDFTEGSGELASAEIEGPSTLPQIDAAPFWLFLEGNRLPRRPVLTIVFNEKNNPGLQNIAFSGKALTLCENLIVQIWLELIKNSDRLVNAVTKLNERDALRTFASTSWLGSLMADHWLTTLEAIVNCPPEHRPEGLIITPAIYDPKMDLISRHPDNARDIHAITEFYENFKAGKQGKASLN